jgi:hypothetical protein
MAKIVMLRHCDPVTWDAWWKERLGLKGRCRIRIASIQRSAA